MIPAHTLLATSSNPAADPRLVNLVVDGNSIYAFTPTMAENVAEDPTLAPWAPTWTSTAVGGATWASMNSEHAQPVADAWNPNRRNVLVVGETGNQAAAGGGTSAATIEGLVGDYLDVVRAAHPWEVLLVGTTPRYFTSAAPYPQLNATMSEVDDWMADNVAQLGVLGYVDVRTGIPTFDNDGTSRADYDAHPDDWVTNDLVHPSTLGRAKIAARIAETLAPLL